MSEPKLREALEGLREVLQAELLEVDDEMVEAVKAKILAMLAAYPVGVEPPAIPPRGRDNHGDRASKLIEDYSEVIADIRERVEAKERVDWVDCKNLLRIVDALATPSAAPQPKEQVGERTQASMEAFELWLARELEDGEPSYHEAWDAGERFASQPPTPEGKEQE